MVQNPKTVKMLGTNRFVLELIESLSGSYYIVTEIDEKKIFSEPIKDLSVALYYFDMKMKELEGH